MLTLTGTQGLLNQATWLLPSSEDRTEERTLIEEEGTGSHPDVYALPGLCLLSNYYVLFPELDAKKWPAGSTVGDGLVSRKPLSPGINAGAEYCAEESVPSPTPPSPLGDELGLDAQVQLLAGWPWANRSLLHLSSVRGCSLVGMGWSLRD